MKRKDEEEGQCGERREGAKLKHGIGSCLCLAAAYRSGLDPCVSQCESAAAVSPHRTSCVIPARGRRNLARSHRAPAAAPASEGEIGGIVALERRKQRSALSLSLRSVGRSVGPIVSEKGGIQLSSSMQRASLPPSSLPRIGRGLHRATFTGLLRKFVPARSRLMLAHPFHRPQAQHNR